MIPIGENPGVSIAIDRELRMEPLALAILMLITVDCLQVEIPEQFAFILEAAIGRNDFDTIEPSRHAGQFFIQSPGSF